MAFLEELLSLILNAFFKQAIPVALEQAKQPSTMIDVTPDASLNDELQNDLESQIAAGGAAGIPH